LSVKGINGATSGATSLIQNEIFHHVVLFPIVVAPGDSLSLKERRKLLYTPFTTYSTPGRPVSLTFALVDRLRKSRFHLQARLCCTACNIISLTWMVGLRFDGVVGYRICLTHRRPPVRARVEPFFLYGPLLHSIRLHVTPPAFHFMAH
jgi:hypothetical protein